MKPIFLPSKEKCQKGDCCLASEKENDGVINCRSVTIQTGPSKDVYHGKRTEDIPIIDEPCHNND